MRLWTPPIYLLVCAAAPPFAWGQAGWKTFPFGKGFSLKTPVAFETVDTPTQRKGDGQSWIGTYKGISFVVIVGPVHVSDLGNSDKVAVEEQKLFDYITSHNPSSVTDQKDLLLKGWPGMKFLFTKGDSRVEFHSYYLGSTSVLISASYPPNSNPSNICDPFFASLSIGKMHRGPLEVPIRRWRTVSQAGGRVKYQLPGAPSATYRDGSGGDHIGVQALSELYAGMARVLPKGAGATTADQAKIRASAVEENAKLIQSVSMKSTEGRLGEDRATFTNYVLANAMVAKSVAVVRRGVLAVLVVASPSGLIGNPGIDRCLHSLRIR